MHKILIVDDEKGVRESLKFSLKDEYGIMLAESGSQALELFETGNPSLVILDIMLPDSNGIEILRKMKEKDPKIPVVMLTAVSQVKTAVDAMKTGAEEYITKPFDVEELKIAVEKIFKRCGLEGHISLLKEELSMEYPVSKIVYKSAVMARVLSECGKVAATDSSVLITGPTGVGKELVARFIHENSGRTDYPFVPVHCAAIPETLFESELFGYEKGAFTNAVKSKKGKIESAGSGTVFFDEVSEIPLSMQVKLLRFLQEGEFSRLGSNDIIKSGARVLSASSKDLLSEVAGQAFREELFYRLNVIPVYIPPLKERKEDIIPLLEFYVMFFKRRFLCKTEKFSDKALQALTVYDWPGNVRELKNITERLLVLNGGKRIIGEGDLPEGFYVAGGDSSCIPLKTQVENFEKEIIGNVLSKTGYNQTRAAEELKTTRRILRYKAQKYGFDENGAEKEDTDS